MFPLPVPHMMALVMSQLQPMLEGFNRSLELLSRQVGALAYDVAQLKTETHLGLQHGPELDEATEDRLEVRLDEVFQHVRDLRRQLEGQQTHMETRLHSQHAMLHYNLTTFKTDVDMKLKRHQKMLQVSNDNAVVRSVINNQSKRLLLTPGQPTGHECHTD